MTQILERKVAVRDAKARAYLQQRIEEAARVLSDRGDVKAKVELCNEALFAFSDKIYDRDADGSWVYIDTKTYRILIVKPWGNSGWKTSGLRQREARVLSKVLLNRVRSGQVVLFDYNEAGREWYLNISQFRSRDAAFNYLEKYPVTVKDWLQVVQ